MTYRTYPSVWPNTVLMDPTYKGLLPVSDLLPNCSPSKKALLTASASTGSEGEKISISVTYRK